MATRLLIKNTHQNQIQGRNQREKTPSKPGQRVCAAQELVAWVKAAESWLMGPRIYAQPMGMWKFIKNPESLQRCNKYVFDIYFQAG